MPRQSPTSPLAASAASYDRTLAGRGATTARDDSPPPTSLSATASTNARIAAAIEAINQPLSKEQIIAAAYYLSEVVDAFSYWTVTRIVRLITEAVIEVVVPPDGILKASKEQLHDPRGPFAAYVLYTRGRPADSFTVVLGGGVTVVAGAEGFRTEKRSWSMLGESTLSKHSGIAFVPTYTAFVSRPTRLLRISNSLFRTHLRQNATAVLVANASETSTNVGANDALDQFGGQSLSAQFTTDLSSITLDTNDTAGSPPATQTMRVEDPRLYDDDEELPEDFALSFASREAMSAAATDKPTAPRGVSVAPESPQPQS